VIVQLGDFGAWEHTPDGVRYFDDVSEAAVEAGIAVYWLDGNHDKSSLVCSLYGMMADAEGFLQVRDNLLYAHRGHRWTWSGVRFMALGGAYSVDKPYRLKREAQLLAQARRDNERRRAWDAPPLPLPDVEGMFWFPEEEIRQEELHGILANRTPVDVLLTHDKPRASNPQWQLRDLPECWPNQDRIQKAVTALHPKLLVHGHLHWRYRDTIRAGDDDQWCQVEGLGGDPSADEHGGYDPADSWMVLDLADFAGA
jgi:hypothetical protein